MFSADEERYYNAQVKWVKLPLKTDNLRGSAFFRHVQIYANALDGNLRTVPQTLPLCQFSEPRIDAYNSGGAQRVDVTTYILEPQYWTIQLDLDGSVIGGSDIPEKIKITEEGTEEWTLDASVELEGSLGAEGSYGVLEYSASVKGKFGASWKKQVMTKYIKEKEIEGTKAYQSIKLRPRLVSRVKSSYRTSLLIDAKRYGIAVTRTGNQVSNKEKLESNLSLAKWFAGGDVGTAADAFGKTCLVKGEIQIDEAFPYTWKVIQKFFIDMTFLPSYNDGKLLVWYKRHKHVDKYPWITESDSYDEQLSISKGYAVLDGIKNDEEKLVHDFGFGSLFHPWKVIAEIGDSAK